MHPHSPVQVWPLYTSNSSFSAPEKITFVLKDFNSLQKIFVRPSSASLRINRGGAAAKTVVCCTAITLVRQPICTGRPRPNPALDMQLPGFLADEMAT